MQRSSGSTPIASRHSAPLSYSRSATPAGSAYSNNPPPRHHDTVANYVADEEAAELPFTMPQSTVLRPRPATASDLGGGGSQMAASASGNQHSVKSDAPERTSSNSRVPVTKRDSGVAPSDRRSAPQSSHHGSDTGMGEWGRGGLFDARPMPLRQPSNSQPRQPSTTSAASEPFTPDPPQAQPDRRRTGNPDYIDEDNLSHYSSLKVRIVEYLRRTLVPMHRKGKVTRYEMISLCSEVCKSFVEERGLDEETMEGMSTEKLPVEDEMLLSSLLLANMRDKQRREAEKELTSFTDALRDAKMEDARKLQERLFQENIAELQKEREALSNARKEFAEQQAQILSQARHVNEFREGAGGAPLPDYVPMMSMPKAGPESVQQSKGPNSSLVPVPRPPTDSLFQSVTYTVSGRLPTAHTHFNPRIGDQHLRVSINSPPIQESDADIVVSCTVSTRTPVTLTWWLAYGPRKQVLNLDKMYNDRLATTYQISETSFILIFRQGSLVPGWEYTVCLGVTSVTGSVVSAKTSFKVPPEIGRRDPNEDQRKLRMYVGDLHEYVGRDLVGGADAFDGPASPGGNSVASPNPYTGRTQDMYYADDDINEDEYIQQQRRFNMHMGSNKHAADETSHQGQYDVYDGTTGHEAGYRGVVHGRALDKLGGHQNYSDQQIYEEEHTNGIEQDGELDVSEGEMSGSQGSNSYNLARRRSSRRGKAQRSRARNENGSRRGASATTVYPAGQRPGVRGDLNPSFQKPVSEEAPTYQEQLRMFFTDQVMPLYYLSPNPSISEESFNSLVKNIARRFWYAYDRRQTVTDNIKREIIMCIKDEIGQYALVTE